MANAWKQKIKVISYFNSSPSLSPPNNFAFSRQFYLSFFSFICRSLPVPQHWWQSRVGLHQAPANKTRWSLLNTGAILTRLTGHHETMRRFGKSKMGAAWRRFYTASQIECVPGFQRSHTGRCLRAAMQFGIGDPTMVVYHNKSVRTTRTTTTTPPTTAAATQQHHRWGQLNSEYGMA